MQYTRIFGLLGIGLLSAGLRCGTRDEPAPFPAATQTGAGTFGYKVDGREWISDGRYTTSQAPYGSWYRGSLSISANRSNPAGGGAINLSLRAVYGPGRYATDSTTSNTYPYTTSQVAFAEAGYNYQTDSLCRAVITISRLDTIARIVAGTFEGKVVGTRYEPTLGGNVLVQRTISEGRFDVRY